MVTGISMVLPIACALIYNEGDLLPLLVSALLILVLGLPLWWVFRKNHDLGIKDGIFIATFGWILVSALSALPFILHGSIPSFTDAFFEMMSGYTTTGATILTDIESVPKGLFAIPVIPRGLDEQALADVLKRVVEDLDNDRISSEGFDEFFRDLKGSFGRVVTRKPKASRPKSREVYLVAGNYHS